MILPLLFYGSLLFYGFINFVFGFGVFLVAYALWLRRRTEMTYGRVAALSGMLVVAYLSHLAAFGMLSIAIVVTVLFDWALRRTTRAAAARSLLAFVPSLVLLAYGALARGGRGGVAWGSPKEKVSVLGGMFLSYDHRLDALWIGGVIVVAVAAVVLSRSIAIEPSFATLAVVFGLIFLLLPPTLITASNVDARIVPAAIAFALCAVRLSLTARVAATLAICVVALATGRVAVIAVQWENMSNMIAAQVQSLDAALPRNANVYSLFPEGGPQIDKRTRAYAHLASYATIDRNAHVSRTFAERSQQPLVSRVDELAAIDAVAPFTVNLATFRRYTYVWTYRPGAAVRRQLQGRCVTVSTAAASTCAGARPANAGHRSRW